MWMSNTSYFNGNIYPRTSGVPRHFSIRGISCVLISPSQHKKLCPNPKKGKKRRRYPPLPTRLNSCCPVRSAPPSHTPAMTLHCTYDHLHKITCVPGRGGPGRGGDRWYAVKQLQRADEHGIVIRWRNVAIHRRCRFDEETLLYIDDCQLHIGGQHMQVTKM